jgi:hypothetical protein
MRAVESMVVDRFFGGSLVKDVVRACVASDTIAGIRTFMEQHSAEFEQSGLDSGTEHRLEFTIIHNDYCQMVESHLTAALEGRGKTLEDFYKACRRLKEAHAEEFEESLLPFVNVLLAATDYLLFAELMLGSAEKRTYFLYILNGLQADVQRLLG